MYVYVYIYIYMYRYCLYINIVHVFVRTYLLVLCVKNVCLYALMHACTYVRTRSYYVHVPLQTS